MAEPTEPAERARARFAEWNEFSPDFTDWARSYWHEDIVWEEPAEFPDAGVHRGRDACMRRMEERLRLLGGVQIELLHAEQEGDAVYIEVIVQGKGAASGVPAEMRSFYVNRLRDARTIHWREFLEREPARAAFREEVAKSAAAERA